MDKHIAYNEAQKELLFSELIKLAYSLELALKKRNAVETEERNMAASPASPVSEVTEEHNMAACTTGLTLSEVTQEHNMAAPDETVHD